MSATPSSPAAAAASSGTSGGTASSPAPAASSPTKATPPRLSGSSGGDLHPYASRLPVVKKTGNKLADSNAEAIHQQLQQTVHILLSDRSHVVPVFSFLSSRIQELSAVPESHGSECFLKPPSTLTSLASGEYMQWTLLFVSKVMNVSVDLIVAAMKVDDGVLMHCLLAVTGLPPSLRLPQECGVKEVLYEVLQSCVTMCDNRFRDFRGIRQDGHVDWQVGAYELATANKKITKVRHIMTNCTVEVENLNLDTSYALLDNFSDHVAALVKKPLPPIRLIQLFDAKAKQGPHGHPVIANLCKAKAFNSHVATIYSSFLQAKEVAGGGIVSAMDTETKNALDEMQQAKRKEISKAARDKASEVLTAKKAKRTIKLQNSDPKPPAKK